MLSAIIAGALLSVIVISLWKTLNHRAIRDHQRRLETAIIALYNYNDVVRHMPPRVIRTQTGKALGSWRMALVPYLPSPSFVDLGVPWNARANRYLASSPMYPFCFTEKPYTNIVAVAGPDTAFDHREATAISDFPNDLIVLVEYKARRISWAGPGDVRLADIDSAITRGYHGNGINVAFVDHVVWYLDNTVPSNLLRRFCTVAGARKLNRDVELSAYVRFSMP